MKPTIDIYTGSPIEIESEKVFLATLTRDLEAQGQSALVMANFFPGTSPHQVDFLIVTKSCVSHVELKNYTAPVVGDKTRNGPWCLIQPNGTRIMLERKNPYRQALDCKYAISDQMHRLARKGKVPHPPVHAEKFFKFFHSTVCVFPRLVDGSRVPNDQMVRTMGYAQFLDFICRDQTLPGWSNDNWLEFAMDNALVRDEECTAAHDSELQAARDKVEQYQQRFQEWCRNDLHELVPTNLRIGQCTKPSDQLVNLLERKRHVQLVGPSGYGKTHLARYAALQLVSSGGAPIFVSAARYDGRLSALLDRSVARFLPNTAVHLLNTTAITGSAVALIIDGYNECSKRLQASPHFSPHLSRRRFWDLILKVDWFRGSLDEVLCSRRRHGAVQWPKRAALDPDIAIFGADSSGRFRLAYKAFECPRPIGGQQRSGVSTGRGIGAALNRFSYTLPNTS